MVAREKIVVIEGDASAGRQLCALLQSAGYDAVAAESCTAGLAKVRAGNVDLLLLSADLPSLDCRHVLAELKGSAATAATRVILLASGGAEQRVAALDLGADDVLSRPGEPEELLARVRAQLRARKELDELRRQARLAEEGQQIAHTAFQALAVTEKMTRDAFSLDRRLKLGIAIFIIVAAVMAGIFALFSRRATREQARVYAAIARLEHGIASQEELVARASKMREEMERASASAAGGEKQQLQQQTEELRARMAAADSGEVAALRKQLAETNSHLHRLDAENRAAQSIIRSYGPSVAMLHVTVAFRHTESGKRLRYGGLNPQGEPIQDSEGNPVYDLEGRGPEVHADFFGTAFLVAADGRLLTNRHVVEPWWKDAELNSVRQQGFEPVIAEMNAYFPGAPAPVPVETRKISPVTDLAIVQGNLGGLKRAVIELDARREAAISGQPMVLMGYATGLDAILARAGEDMLRSIVAASNGNPKNIMGELAKRGLIRPLTTQGHVGDVLADKIVYDAQTTSGGSGGPVFNAQGKVIGVNFAVVRGFGGSNFGIPIRFAQSLLK